MKELSIEEKARRYDEAIERAKEINREHSKKGFKPSDDVLYIFPELAESEDENIRKSLIDMLKNDEKCYLKEIAWLEKQGKQKLVEKYNITGIGSKNAQGKLGKMIKNLKPADKVEPKFKIGDWVIDKQGIVHQIANVIENVTNHTYSYDIVGGGYFNDNTEGVRLWTIRDAKDGTVLVASDGSIFLFKDRVYSACKYYIALTTDGAVKFNNDGLEHYWETVTAVHPATKEQQDLLFQKMKEAGYEWNADEKKLEKIEQNPAWSEKDESILNQTLFYLGAYKNGCSGLPVLYMNECISWLKSLRPQNRWKPSDEQMEGLECTIKTLKYQLNAGDNRLDSLYNDLKKLREK